MKAYNIDLLEEDTSGNKLISHIIFDKLPNIIKRELVHKVDSNFPTVNQFFDNYNDILKTLSRTSYKKDYDKQKSQSSTPVKSQNASSSKVRNDKGQRNHREKSKPCSTLENFQTKTEKSGTYKCSSALNIPVMMQEPIDVRSSTCVLCVQAPNI